MHHTLCLGTKSTPFRADSRGFRADGATGRAPADVYFFDDLEHRGKALNEMFSFFVGSPTDAIQAENERGKEIAASFFEKRKPLQNAAGDQSQLAFLLAHESAHTLLGNMAAKLRRDLVMETGTNVISAASLLTSMASGVAAKIAASLVDDSFSAAQEFEADQLAVHIVKRSGIRPRGGISLLKKLEKKYEDKPARAKLTYVASHPPSGERIKCIGEEIAAIEEKKEKR